MARRSRSKSAGDSEGGDASFFAIIVAIIAIVLAIIAFVGKKKEAERKGYAEKVYTPKYVSQRHEALPSREQAAADANASGMPGCKFLLCAKQALSRDMVLIIDRSGSMSSQGRWEQAQECVEHLASHVVRADPDGITLMLFDHKIESFDHVTSRERVAEIFGQYRPRGSTDLALALDTAFEEHFNGTRGRTTILVITDGQPNCTASVESVIVAASKAIEHEGELSISFIQVGRDRAATNFLTRLDDDLVEAGAKCDIVDTITAEQMQKISFNELIANSLFD